MKPKPRRKKPCGCETFCCRNSIDKDYYCEEVVGFKQKKLEAAVLKRCLEWLEFHGGTVDGYIYDEDMRLVRAISRLQTFRKENSIK